MRQQSWFKARAPRPCLRVIAAAAFAAALLSGCETDVPDESDSPPEYTGSAMRIEKQGAFAVGGRVLGDPATSSLHCDHGVVEYQIPPEPRD